MLCVFTDRKTASIDQEYGVGSDAGAAERYRLWATVAAPAGVIGGPRIRSLPVDICRAGSIETKSQGQENS